MSSGREQEQAAVGRISLAQRLAAEKLRRSRGDVHDAADKLLVGLVHELVETEIEIVETRAELRGVVVSQQRRIEMFEVRRGLHERPFGLRHLLAADRQEAVNVNFRR